MNNHRQFKDNVYEEFALVAKAMGNRKRFELLDLLSQGPRTVEVLAGEASLPVANASHHLQALKEARLVETSKEGLYVTYRLVAGVDALLAGVRKVAERNRAEVDRLYRDHFGEAALEAYDREALLEKVRRGEAEVWDVRPPEEYAAAHVAGALSVPLKDLEKRLRAVPKNTEIVAYCRGRYCMLAVQAVSKLRDKGFTAFRLEESVSDLKKRGVRIEKGAAA
jgi:ArsR family transcriptional regulator